MIVLVLEQNILYKLLGKYLDDKIPLPQQSWYKQ